MLEKISQLFLSTFYESLFILILALKMLSFLLTNLSSEKLFLYIPQFLIYPIKSFLTSLCQIPHFYDLLIIPDCVWESFWVDESRRKVGTFPLIPDAYLQDPECFKMILKRIITLGLLCFL